MAGGAIHGAYTKKGVAPMHFTVEFYESASGSVPVEEFLEELRLSDQSVYAHILQRLNRLRDSANHGHPLTDDLGGGLLELRYLGRLNTRVFWFFAVGRRIVLVHAIRNKGQKISERDRKIALQRRSDWLRRNTK